ncbi:unnamed protein product [Brassicogethes aeneus]|uniref:Major facilitator superfamily (MFS) profile domain-containing protein n=1 Tax=Brassicogethes aeneus TaxID=1431903 RepID=A0A9P0BM12_BRAAE|nr:unnamed protein product [Brassicogethes aeneus]
MKNEDSCFQSISLCGKKIPFRFWIGVMIFMTTFVNYVMRSNMSVSILAMTKHHKNQSHMGSCLANSTFDNLTTPLTTLAPVIPKFEDEGIFETREYTQRQQSQILAAYGYGYVASSVLGGFLSEYFGPWKTVFYSNLGMVIFTVLCVPAALIHWTALFATRVLIGALGGVVYPAVQVLISRWAPKEEKGKFLSAMLGNTLGTAIAFPVIGLISQYMNWAWGFFFIGIVVSLYLIAIFFILSDGPDKSTLISEEEKDYLAVAVPPPKEKLVAPYYQIFTSVPFYGLLGAHVANLYGLFVLIISVPKFFKEYLGQDLKQSGILSAMPQLFRLVSGILFGIIGDKLESKNYISVTALRKSFILFSHIIPGVCMICMQFVGCNQLAATALLVLTQAFNGAVVCTNLRNPQDLAPNFAGTIFGIISLIAGCTQFIVPVVTGELLGDNPNPGLDRWKWVFLIGGGNYILGGLIFILLASGKKQSWNEPKETKASIT